MSSCATTWTQQAKVTAADGALGDTFGWSVALHDDTALVGAFAKNSSVGAAYVFGRQGNSLGPAGETGTGGRRSPGQLRLVSSFEPQHCNCRGVWSERKHRRRLVLFAQRHGLDAPGEANRPGWESERLLRILRRGERNPGGRRRFR